MVKKVQVAKYAVFDLLGSALAWVAFNLYRKRVVESALLGVDLPLTPDAKFYVGLLAFPAFWVFLFGLAGFYHNVFRKSRLKELGVSLGFTVLGCLLIFFALLLDDYVVSYRSHYQKLLILFALVFTLTYLPRLALTTLTTRRIHSRQIGFPTVIVGSGQSALALCEELNAEKKSQGYKLVGYIAVGSEEGHALGSLLPCLGELGELGSIAKSNGIEEVILATAHEKPQTLAMIINELLPLNVKIKAIPSMYDHLAGRVKMTSILGAPLLSVSFELMPPWQANLKQMLDYALSALALAMLLPLFVVLALVIKLSSGGPVLYRQERVGQYGKPFTLLKFRSMRSNAEEGGPALSSKNDPRVTPVGRFMRKTRLDELPNFINVIRGDMSLVGPRPERQFYIDQILRVAPHYVHLQKVKPGITSWGQVKYGYAESVPQMVERLKYDLLYLENMSLMVDFKIIIHTMVTVLRGKGV